jgi:subtilase family protein/fervidolysin-like protein
MTGSKRTLKWMAVALVSIFAVGAAVAVQKPLAAQDRGASGPSIGAAKAGYGVGAAGLQAGRDYVAGQVIVGLHSWGKEGTGPRYTAPAGAQTVGVIHGSAVLLDFSSEALAQKALPALLSDPNVSFVERNGFMSIPPMPPAPAKNGKATRVSDPLNRDRAQQGSPGALSVSTDPGTGHQWHHTVIRKTPALGVLSTTPPTVAIIDTGIDYTHSDLIGRVTLSRNCVGDNNDPFDDQGHGTHVAGIVGAIAANGNYGEGVSHLSRLVAIKVLNDTGGGTFFQVACGMHFGHTVVTSPPTRVGNMSIGGPASALINTEVTHWNASGRLLVVAAGNSNNTGAGTFNINPAIRLRVMASNENNCRTSFTNHNTAALPNQFNIAAPGRQIYSTLPNEGWEPFDGTSMASPVVAGAAALLWGQVPALTAAQVAARLIANGRTTNCGWGTVTRIVDVRRAIFVTPETVVIGRALDANTGESPTPNTAGATVEVRNGVTVLGSDLTNRGGSYEVSGAGLAGVRNLFGRKPVAACAAGALGCYVPEMLRSPFTVLNGVYTGPFTDAMSKSRAAGNFYAELDWQTVTPLTDAAGTNTRGFELDFRMMTPVGQIPPSGFFAPAGDLSGAPFVFISRDSFNDFEPVEGLIIGPSASNGVYKIVVDRTLGPGLNLNASGAQVRLFDGPTATTFLNAPACTPANRIWHVADITKSGGSYVTTVMNACRSTLP